MADSSSPRHFFGHPLGLASLFGTEMFERFSYYGMRALLILFMTATAAHGGLGVDAQAAGAIYGLYASGVYLAGLPGGWVADRVLGQREAVFWGGVLIAAGNFLLAVPRGTTVFYIGLLVIALGTGLLKPNASSLVGELYKGQSGSRRDSAYSIYYLGINLGGFVAPFVAGTIGETVGFHWGFLAAGLAMVVGLVWFRASEGWLGDAGHLSTALTAAARRHSRTLLIICAIAIVAIVALAAVDVLRLDVVGLAHAARYILPAIAAVFFIYALGFGGLTVIEKKRVGVIAVFVVSFSIFWAGYEQAGSTLNLFARDFTDRSLLGSWFASGQHPASWYQSIPPVFVLLLAPVFAWMWVSLDRHHRDPSAPAKLGAGMVILGLSFALMMVAARLVISSGHAVMPGWLWATYFLQVAGELCLSPIGLSNVSKLAPERFVGQMMGALFLGMAIGNLNAGLIGGAAGSGGITSLPDLVLKVALLSAGAGVVLLFASRALRVWMGGVR